MALRAAFVSLLACSLVGCHRDGSEDAGATTSGSPAASAPGPHAPKARASETAHIPVGPFRAGSTPGEAGRRPDLEPSETEVRLGPFQIDLLPYPNDPAKPPMLGVTREAAMRLCAEENGRLCTELEWERACKGPENHPYPSGATWNDACEKDPLSCQNGFEVGGMGTLLEWTSSEVVPPHGETKPSGPVVRGSASPVPGAERRCARRVTADDLPDDAKVGFRCCHGAPNGAKIQEPTDGEAFRKVELGIPDLKRLLESDPRTKSLANDVTLFREPEAAQTVIDRGPGDRMGFDFTVAPLEWSPARGARFLVLTGRSGDKTSFVLAYYILGKSEHRLAASFVMQNEPGPVTFAYSPSIRPRLHFSTCWGCPGETGKLLFRAPERVVIFQP